QTARGKSKKATQVAFFSVFSLSLWERVGVRAPDRTQTTPQPLSHNHHPPDAWLSLICKQTVIFL
ncbi:hypothetical protein, partial [Enterobacter asburiae]|uniref:hypothetical protein n=1 Tax=Enterobacter asburiae TaxID=61645 RepID=UPI00195533E5